MLSKCWGEMCAKAVGIRLVYPSTQSGDNLLSVMVSTTPNSG